MARVGNVVCFVVVDLKPGISELVLGVHLVVQLQIKSDVGAFCIDQVLNFLIIDRALSLIVDQVQLLEAIKLNFLTHRLSLLFCGPLVFPLLAVGFRGPQIVIQSR